MPAELRQVLLGMVNYLQSEQLANGDFPYFRTSGDSFYCPCILLSTLMHDALGYLDPHTRLYEKTYLSDLLSKDEQRFVAASVTGMRIPPPRVHCVAGGIERNLATFWPRK